MVGGQWSVLGTRYSVLSWFIFFPGRQPAGIKVGNGGTTAALEASGQLTVAGSTIRFAGGVGFRPADGRMPIQLLNLLLLAPQIVLGTQVVQVRPLNGQYRESTWLTVGQPPCAEATWQGKVAGSAISFVG